MAQAFNMEPYAAGAADSYQELRDVFSHDAANIPHRKPDIKVKQFKAWLSLVSLNQDAVSAERRIVLSTWVAAALPSFRLHLSLSHTHTHNSISALSRSHSTTLRCDSIAWSLADD